jgi:hypothetical protein
MNEQRFIELALANDVNREILNRLASLELPDAWLVSGGLFQTVWNMLTGREPKYGIKDYDIFYFDPDTSWDAEDTVIKKARKIFAGIDADIEIKNQARVHLWYAEKFGASYPPLRTSREGIDRFLSPTCMVGLQETARKPRNSEPNVQEFEVYAPCGFDDLEALVVRPNLTANFTKEAYDTKAARWKSMWPELTVMPA